MTPEKRLNQIEPELAEVIQKVDRLIESNGKILDLAINTKAELETVKAAGESTARAVANLTVSTQAQFDQVNARFDTVDSRFDRVDVNQNEMRLDIAQLKAGQELILKILREKLS